MTLDQAEHTFGYQASVVDYAVGVGISKSDMVWLFDKISRLNYKNPESAEVLEIEKLIAKVAEQTFDETIMTMLLEIKKELSSLK